MLSPIFLALSLRATDHFPELYSFEFSASVAGGNTSTAVLSSRYTKNCDDPLIIDSRDQLGNIAIVTGRNGNSGTGNCNTQLRYCNSDYHVVRGVVHIAAAGDANVGFAPVEAFKISSANLTATQFTYSPSVLYWQQLALGVKHTIYALDRTTGVVTSIATEITGGGSEWSATSIKISSQTTDVIYFALKFDIRVSRWPLFDGGVERATLATVLPFVLMAERFDLSSIPGAPQPFQPSNGWNQGIATHSHKYGTFKRFFQVSTKTGGEGIVWQDPTSRNIYVTWLPSTSTSGGATTILLPTLVQAATSYLEAAVGNDDEEIIYAVMEHGNNPDKLTPTTFHGFKVDGATGNIIVEKAWDTSKTGMNILTHFMSGASLQWSTNTNELAMIISRTMTRGGDGLTHQGAIGLILNAETLDVIKNFGQFSGHSFANFLTVSKNKMVVKNGNSSILDPKWHVDNSTIEFLGVDLGDNYPRGINMHRFSLKKRVSKVHYCFKTKHASCKITAQTTTCPATGGQGGTHPLYPEISSPLPRTALGSTTFYKQVREEHKREALGHFFLSYHLTSSSSLVHFNPSPTITASTQRSRTAGLWRWRTKRSWYSLPESNRLSTMHLSIPILMLRGISRW